VVLWMGVFGILGKMSIVKDITEKVNKAGQWVGTKIATAPYWAPVLPLGKGGERQSIGTTVAPILQPFKEFEDYYSKQMHPLRDTRNLQRVAADKDYSAYGKKASEGGLTEDDGRKIASGYGYSNVSEMMATHNEDALIAAFTKSKVTGGNEKKLYDALSNMAKPKTSTQITQEAEATAIANNAEAAKHPAPPPPAVTGSGIPQGGPAKK